VSPGIIHLNYTLAVNENITTSNIQEDSDNESFYSVIEEHTSNDSHNNNLASTQTSETTVSTNTILQELQVYTGSTAQIKTLLDKQYNATILKNPSSIVIQHCFNNGRCICKHCGITFALRYRTCRRCQQPLTRHIPTTITTPTLETATTVTNFSTPPDIQIINAIQKISALKIPTVTHIPKSLRLEYARTLTTTLNELNNNPTNSIFQNFICGWSIRLQAQSPD
jgi:hypothetical protein